MSSITYNSKDGIGQIDGRRIASINEEGRLDVTQHSHAYSLTTHISVDLAVSTDYILIDVDDPVYNYRSGGITDYVHIEAITYDIDADINGDYVIQIGYLKEVGATNGVFKPLYRISGDKQDGNSKEGVINLYPNGPRCVNGYVLSANEIPSTDFSSSSELGTTLLPTGSVNPGNGDLILRVIINDGSISLSLNTTYHID